MYSAQKASHTIQLIAVAACRRATLDERSSIISAGTISRARNARGRSVARSSRSKAVRPLLTVHLTRMQAYARLSLHHGRARMALERMPELLILSRKKAEAYEPSGREACISITDVGDAPLPALSSAFVAVLRVAFSDIDEPSADPSEVLFNEHHATANHGLRPPMAARGSHRRALHGGPEPIPGYRAGPERPVFLGSWRSGRAVSLVEPVGPTGTGQGRTRGRCPHDATPTLGLRPDRRTRPAAPAGNSRAPRRPPG